MMDYWYILVGIIFGAVVFLVSSYWIVSKDDKTNKDGEDWILFIANGFGIPLCFSLLTFLVWPAVLAFGGIFALITWQKRSKSKKDTDEE